MKTENITSVKLLRHIADLHEEGIVADQAKVDEEYAEWESSKDPVKAADFMLAYTSQDFFYTVNRFFKEVDVDFYTAIAKNQRRLDWMKANPDPTKTPIELWEAAKIALKEVEHE